MTWADDRAFNLKHFNTPEVQSALADHDAHSLLQYLYVAMLQSSDTVAQGVLEDPEHKRELIRLVEEVI